LGSRRFLIFVLGVCVLWDTCEKGSPLASNLKLAAAMLARHAAWVWGVAPRRRKQFELAVGVSDHPGVCWYRSHGSESLLAPAKRPPALQKKKNLVLALRRWFWTAYGLPSSDWHRDRGLFVLHTLFLLGFRVLYVFPPQTRWRHVCNAWAPHGTAGCPGLFISRRRQPSLRVSSLSEKKNR